MHIRTGFERSKVDELVNHLDKDLRTALHIAAAGGHRVRGGGGEGVRGEGGGVEGGKIKPCIMQHSYIIAIKFVQYHVCM